MQIRDARFVVIDTETTGLDYEAGHRIVEVAFRQYGGAGDELQMLVNPGIPIPIEVSAVHHLTDRDVADAPTLQEAYDVLDAHLGDNAVLVAHNAEFDRSMLPSLEKRPWLCTKRLAQHLVPDAPRFSNQVLRYYFGGLDLDLRGLAPHRAMADVIVTDFIFGQLLELYVRSAGFTSSIDSMIAYAESPVMLQRMPFGMHAGKLMSELPIDYLVWGTGARSKIADRDVVYSLKKEFARRRAVEKEQRDGTVALL